MVKIGAAAEMLGTTPGTLRRWESTGELLPARKTKGGTRYYAVSDLLAVNDVSAPTIGYARVSGQRQKDDLKRQQEMLETYGAAKGWRMEVISDLGSGMNYHKPGLQRLIELILRRQLRRLVLTHKDRLLRFGAGLVFALCEQQGVEVVIIHQGDQPSFEEELGPGRARNHHSVQRKAVWESEQEASSNVGSPDGDRDGRVSAAVEFPVILAHKTAIRNQAAVGRALAQHDGAERWAWNQLLFALKDSIEADPKNWPTVGSLAKQLRRAKPDWWANVHWEMLDNARQRLSAALGRWRQCRKGKHHWHKAGSCGFPTFHRRGDRKAVTFSSHVADQRGQVKWVDQRHIRLPKVGIITLAEPLPEPGWVKEIHCVREGGKWYAVLVYENGRKLPDTAGEGPVVGVDVGIKALAMTSDGVEYENPRWTERTARQLRKVNKAIARSRTLNPNTRPKRRQRLYAQRARLQAQQADQRLTHHRNVASAIAKSAGVVVVESLNVAGMLRNRRISRALSDAGVGGLLRELEWQCAKRGVRFLAAGRWFPSTQLCARCGERPDERLNLKVRTYRCEHCGWECDRDHNAAINMKNVAPALWATLKGRGDWISPFVRAAQVGEASMETAVGQPALIPQAV